MNKAELLQKAVDLGIIDTPEKLSEVNNDVLKDVIANFEAKIEEAKSSANDEAVAEAKEAGIAEGKELGIAEGNKFDDEQTKDQKIATLEQTLQSVQTKADTADQLIEDNNELRGELEKAQEANETLSGQLDEAKSNAGAKLINEKNAAAAFSEITEKYPDVVTGELSKQIVAKRRTEQAMTSMKEQLTAVQNSIGLIKETKVQVDK